eukprot:m.118260 g.118260  ORF g.118260 m.118260 type:complete len:82 (+) comp12890_c0_seq5:514-759(+)
MLPHFKRTQLFLQCDTLTTKTQSVSSLGNYYNEQFLSFGYYLEYSVNESHVSVLTDVLMLLFAQSWLLLLLLEDKVFKVLL